MPSTQAYHCVMVNMVKVQVAWHQMARIILFGSNENVVPFFASNIGAQIINSSLPHPGRMY